MKLNYNPIETIDGKLIGFQEINSVGETLRITDFNGGVLELSEYQISKENAEQPDWALDEPERAIEKEVFQPLTRKQLLLGLFSGGVTEAMVLAAIKANPNETAREQTRIEFTENNLFNRGHPLIATLGAAFQLDAAKIDTLWRYAQQI